MLHFSCGNETVLSVVRVFVEVRNSECPVSERLITKLFDVVFVLLCT